MGGLKKQEKKPFEPEVGTVGLTLKYHQCCSVVALESVCVGAIPKPDKPEIPNSKDQIPK